MMSAKKLTGRDRLVKSADMVDIINCNVQNNNKVVALYNIPSKVWTLHHLHHENF